MSEVVVDGASGEKEKKADKKEKKSSYEYGSLCPSVAQVSVRTSVVLRYVIV